MSFNQLNSLKRIIFKTSCINHARKLSTASLSTLQKPNWKQTLSEAEKIVDSPTSALGLRWLLSDDIANVSQHFHTIKDSNHPVIKLAKELLQNRQSNVQTWGLIIMLLSRAVGQEKSQTVIDSQQILAEAIEKIHCSRLMHQSMFNLQSQSQNTNDLINDGDNKFGNMLALLSGDYLVVNAFALISNLRNQKLVQLIGSVTRDLVESNFIGDRDNQNNALPSDPRKTAEITMEEFATHAKEYEDDVPNIKSLPLENVFGDPEKEWTYHHTLIAGTLLGKGCQGAMMLAEQTKDLQQQAFLFGKNLALAWQAYIDMQPYRQAVLPAGAQFSLISAPLLFHLAHDPQMYDLISKGSISVDNIDYVEVHRQIRGGPGLEKTKQMQRKHSLAAMAIINKLHPSDAQNALQKIILAMQEL